MIFTFYLAKSKLYSIIVIGWGTYNIYYNTLRRENVFEIMAKTLMSNIRCQVATDRDPRRH